MEQILRPLLTLSRSSRTYVLVSVLVIATATGMFLAASALLDALLLRLPTGRATEDIVAIATSLPDGIISRPDLIDLQEQLKTVDGVCAFDDATNVSLEIGDRTVSVNCAGVSGNFFEALGVLAASGRVFGAENDRSGTEPVAVLSGEIANELRAAPNTLIRIDGHPFRVTGSLPAQFQNVDRRARVDIWIPLQHVTAYHAPWVVTSRDTEWLHTLARRKTGQSLPAINAELAVVAARLQRDHPDVNHGMGLRATTLRASRLEQQQTARILLVLSATVAAFFALGFLNFFSLTLIRLLARRRQIAVRLALGATQSHLARWLLGELATLLVLGGILGLGASWFFLHSLRSDPLLAQLCVSADVRLNARSVALAALTGICAGAIVWAFAVKAAKRVQLTAVLKESATAPHRRRAFTALFAVQLALTLSLVALSLSFVGTLNAAASAPLPFRTKNMLVASVDTRRLGWISDAEKIARYHQSVVQRLRALPGVIKASASNKAPFARTGWTNVWVDGKDPALSKDQCLADWTFVGSDFFDTMGITLIEGRGFTRAEDVSRPPVAIINRAMAKRYWPGEEALGKTFRSYPSDQVHQVIGVAEDVPLERNAPVRPAFYYLYTSSLNARMTYLIQVPSESRAAIANVHDALSALWPSPDSPDVKTIEQLMTASWSDLTAAVRVVLWVAGLGLLITVVGLYSFSHYVATQSVRDAAIRLALGSTATRLAQDHGQRFRGAFVAGLIMAATLTTFAIWGARRLHLVLVPAGAVELGLAGIAIAVIAAIGLFTPLWQFAKLDLRRLLIGSD